METTLRDRINSYRSELLKINELSFDRASQILVELSALWANVIEESQQRDQLYIHKLIEIISTPKMSVERAKIMSQGTQEYMEREIARGLKEVVMELTRSLKIYLKSKRSEYYEAGSNL